MVSPWGCSPKQRLPAAPGLLGSGSRLRARPLTHSNALSCRSGSRTGGPSGGRGSALGRCSRSEPTSPQPTSCPSSLARRTMPRSVPAPAACSAPAPDLRTHTSGKDPGPLRWGSWLPGPSGPLHQNVGGQSRFCPKPGRVPSSTSPSTLSREGGSEVEAGARRGITAASSPAPTTAWAPSTPSPPRHAGAQLAPSTQSLRSPPEAVYPFVRVNPETSRASAPRPSATDSGFWEM